MPSCPLGGVLLLLQMPLVVGGSPEVKTQEKMAREAPALRNSWARAALLRETDPRLLNVTLEFFPTEELHVGYSVCFFPPFMWNRNWTRSEDIKKCLGRGLEGEGGFLRGWNVPREISLIVRGEVHFIWHNGVIVQHLVGQFVNIYHYFDLAFIIKTLWITERPLYIKCYSG